MAMTHAWYVQIFSLPGWCMMPANALWHCPASKSSLTTGSDGNIEEEDDEDGAEGQECGGVDSSARDFCKNFHCRLAWAYVPSSATNRTGSGDDDDDDDDGGGRWVFIQSDSRTASAEG